MYWEEDQKTKEYEVPDDVVEVLFKLDCKTLPVDHNLLLSQALIKELPWMATEKDTSIQHVHIAEEANGWFRPRCCRYNVAFVTTRQSDSAYS